MKYILVLLFAFTSFFLHGQACNEDNHSININDSWVSCQLNSNPNPARGNSHWVHYDFGYVYSLGATNFWNYNVAGETDKGMKSVTIDYSLDGTTWTELASFQLGEASGMNSYTGESGPDFNDIDARYVLITSIDTWGTSGCAGLSEVLFNVDGLVANEELPLGDKQLALFPNPAADRLSIETDLLLEELIVLGAAGQEIARFSYAETVDISFLPDGIYFLKCLTSNNEQYTQRFVKQR